MHAKGFFALLRGPLMNFSINLVNFTIVHSYDLCHLPQSVCELANWPLLDSIEDTPNTRRLWNEIFYLFYRTWLVYKSSFNWIDTHFCCCHLIRMTMAFFMCMEWWCTILNYMNELIFEMINAQTNEILERNIKAHTDTKILHWNIREGG